MTELTALRLNFLRAAYLVMAGGLAVYMWPAILNHPLNVPRMSGVATSMLGALAMLAVIGLRCPLVMLPILIFELLWKVIWLSAYAFPLWRAGQMNEATAATVAECVPVALFVLVIPWRYVFDRFVRTPADPWRKAPQEKR
jgi:hypothetical protein